MFQVSDNQADFFSGVDVRLVLRHPLSLTKTEPGVQSPEGLPFGEARDEVSVMNRQLHHRCAVSIAVCI